MDSSTADRDAAEKIAALLTENEAYEARVFERREAYPLTSNQMGLYFACVKDPASLLYNIPIALNMGNADAEKLRESAAHNGLCVEV